MHNWVSLLPILEYAYDSSIHSVTGKTPFELEGGWTPQMLRDCLLRRTFQLHPSADKFQKMMLQAESFTNKCLKDAVDYNKSRWDKTHREHDIKVRDRVLISTVNFQNLGGSRKLKAQFVGPFFVKNLHGKNTGEVILTEGYDLKHLTFLVSLVKKYISQNNKQ